MKRKHLIKFVLLSFCTLLNVFAVSFTLAAFVYSEKYSQSYTVDLGYNDQFYSYDKATNTYTIQDKYDGTNLVLSASEQLRNLSKITSTGLLDPKVTFKLGYANPTDRVLKYTGEPLAPIGTMHTPFTATFDGNGKIIEDLKVVGLDSADTGMFGYIGMSGKVSNLLLDSPIIECKSSDVSYAYSDSANNIDSNPLRKHLTREFCEQIVFDPDISGTELNSPNGKFVTGMLYLPTLPNISSVTRLKYSISFSNTNIKAKRNVKNDTKTSLCYDISGFSTLTKTENISMSIQVYGLCELSPADKNLRLVQYTLEVYRFSYDAKLNGCYGNKDNPNCFEKLICSDKKDNALTGASTMTRHVIYAGVVAGTLDGKVDHILVYNPKICAYNRPFNSNNILIGRKIGDYAGGLLIREKCLSHVVLKDKDYGNINMVNNYYEDNFESPDVRKHFKVGNSYCLAVFSENVDETKEGYFSQKFQKNFRIYGSTENRDSAGDTGVGLEKRTFEVKDDQGNITYEKKHNIYLNGDMETGLLYQDIGDDGFSNVVASKCFSLWINPGEESTLGSGFSKGSKDLYVKIVLDYLMYDYGFGMGVAPNPSNSRIYFEICKMQREEEPFTKNGKTYMHRRFSSNVYNNGIDPNDYSKYSLQTCYTSNGLKYKPTWPAYTTNHKHNNLIWALDRFDTKGLYERNNPKYDPQTGELIPTNQNVILKETGDPEKPDPTKFYEDQHGHGLNQNVNGVEVHTPLRKTFEIKFSNDYFKEPEGVSLNRSPIIFFGIQSAHSRPGLDLEYHHPDANGNNEKPRDNKEFFNFEFINIDITMSDKDGNMLGEKSSIDFGVMGNDLTPVAPTYDSGSNQWTAWPSQTGANPIIECFKTSVTGPDFTLAPKQGTPNQYIIQVLYDKTTNKTPKLLYNNGGIVAYAPKENIGAEGNIDILEDNSLTR